MNYTDHFNNKLRLIRFGLIWCCALCFSPEWTIAALDPDSLAQKVSCNFTPFQVNPINGLMNNEDGVRAGLLYDVNRKVVVWEKDMNYAYPVASLTKMMVALLAIEDIKSGKANWTDQIEVSRTYIKGKGRHKKRYSVKQTYTLEDLIKLAMVNSNNEATVWIGKKLAGGELEPFIRRMNEKCAELGMQHTFYSNPSGLPAVSGELDNSSSPNDLLRLALELINHDELLKITSLGFATINESNKNHIYRNHNGLVIQYPNEVDGLKTGYTKNARFCLVATATRGGHRLMGIVLGARNVYARNSIVADMMNNYYQLLGLGSLGQLIIDSTMASVMSDSLNRQMVSNTNPRFKDDSASQSVRKIYVKAKKIHTVKRGETLYAIADKYDCFASEIKKWNKLRSSSLKAGQKITVYQITEKTVAIKFNNADSINNGEQIVKEKQVQAVAKGTVKPKGTVNSNKGKDTGLKGKFVYHIVQPGDTLWNIAQQYAGTTVEKIKKANKIYNTKGLRPGTKLKIQVAT